MHSLKNICKYEKLCKYALANISGNFRDAGSGNISLVASRKDSVYEPNKGNSKWRSVDGQTQQKVDQREAENADEGGAFVRTSTF